MIRAFAENTLVVALAGGAMVARHLAGERFGYRNHRRHSRAAPAGRSMQAGRSRSENWGKRDAVRAAGIHSVPATSHREHPDGRLERAIAPWQVAGLAVLWLGASSSVNGDVSLVACLAPVYPVMSFSGLLMGYRTGRDRAVRDDRTARQVPGTLGDRGRRDGLRRVPVRVVRPRCGTDLTEPLLE